MTEPFLIAKKLSKTFTLPGSKVDVLKEIDLSLDPHQFYAITGPSGAGKTTLLQVLATIDKPDSGELIIQGENVFSWGDNKRSKFRNQNIGIIFQHFELIPELSALENVLLPARIYASNFKSAKKRAAELLEKVGLSQRFHHHPNQLSGGEQQRVSICRSLMNKASLIFADEPTGNLDSETTHNILGLLQSLVDEKEITLIIVTHNQEIAQKANSIIALKDGLVVE